MSVEFSNSSNNWLRHKHPFNGVDRSRKDELSRVDDVRIDMDLSCSVVANEITWKERAILQFHRSKADAFEGVEAGSIIGVGSSVGAGIATLLTLGMAPSNAGDEGVVIAAGLIIGASGGIGAGLAGGISGIKGGVLLVSGVAGVTAGSIVALGIETATEVVTGAVLSAGAATIAAVAAGIFLTVTSGVITRRNWPY